MDEQKRLQHESFQESILNLYIILRPYIKKAWEYKIRLLIFNGCVSVVTVLLLLFVIKPYFRSSIYLLPDYGNKPSDILSQFSGLASLAGVNISDNPTTLYYQNLILSETVISEVIYKKYQTEKFIQPVNLLQYFDIKSDNSLPDSIQKRKMFLMLYNDLTKSLIETNYDRQTNILSVFVEMPESKLSAEVANTLVISLDKYVRTQRKSQAIEQQRYLELRVGQVKDTLTYWEETLKIFREKNRQILQSPEQQLVQSRLIRNVEIQQLIYSELIKQLELIKLTVIKDMPVVNVREYAKDPVIKAGPKRVLISIVTLIISMILSVAWYLNKDEFKKGWRQINHT